MSSTYNNYSRWADNKRKAIYHDTTPSRTDQSQLDETNVNIIMKKYRITGMAPGATKAPMFGDFTELPHDLRELLDQAKAMPGLVASLPEQLRAMPMDQLLALTPDQLQTILTPPATPPANTPTGHTP